MDKTAVSAQGKSLDQGIPESQATSSILRSNVSSSSSMLSIKDGEPGLTISWPSSLQPQSVSDLTTRSEASFSTLSIGRSESEGESSCCSSPRDRQWRMQLRRTESKSMQSGSEYEDDAEFFEDTRRIRVGICAMNKKVNSKPMKEILERLKAFDMIEIITFTDDVIINVSIESWPNVDCLISFYSKGFPLAKAIEYSKLRQPFLLNDLDMQYCLQDRRKVYEILVRENVPTPRHAVLNRDSLGVDDTAPIEIDDSIEVNGLVFHKPFVEKPVDAEDHNIHIFYPVAAGGGSQKLFRKIGLRSSIYSNEMCVRRKGSFIYEQFMPTDGTDVKVYTVGAEYAHAEARKSPSLDGKVERDKEGKEVRYPVILSAQEKEIAKKVCTAFKQTVCGFDLLRTNGQSLVCDVNGFSFVKSSPKYYDDSAQIIADTIIRQFYPALMIPMTLDGPEVPIGGELPQSLEQTNMMELRCVVAVIRHGDRTPKQKMKMLVRHPLFFELFCRLGGMEEGNVKLKKPKHLEEVLSITRSLLDSNVQSGETFENPAKLQQMKYILEMHGHFAGINRKVQIKSLTDQRNEDLRLKSKGRNKGQDAVLNEPALLLILKWGGELTEMGKTQAEELGKAFRCMYPGGQGEYQLPGCGLLRLHSTYRHDLKIYASDEGRVQMTAAAFAKGFLALEGELTPILVHLVKSDKETTSMLDTSSDAQYHLKRVKLSLHNMLLNDHTFTEEDVSNLAPTGSRSLLDAIKVVGNPVHACRRVHELIKHLLDRIRDLISQDKEENFSLYHGDSIKQIERHWAKLEKDFLTFEGNYDISLIPDIYDCARYDYLHNGILGLPEFEDLYHAVEASADIVIPQEYGILKEEKLDVAVHICHKLLCKIRYDLKRITDETETIHRLDPRYSKGVETPHRHVRSRLYFTSESHTHSILNILRYGGLFDEHDDSHWKRASEYIDSVPELSFLSQIIFLQYEDPLVERTSPDRFHVEVYFSPGVRSAEELIQLAKSTSDQTGEVTLKHSNSSNFIALQPEGTGSLVKSSSEGEIATASSFVVKRSSEKTIPQPKTLRPSPVTGLSRHRQSHFKKSDGKAPSPGNSTRRHFPASLRKPCPVSVSGADGYETTPSIYPLRILSGNINEHQMDSFLAKFV